MKYQIKIQGMHCTGCTNLIKMSLEELNMNEVQVDLEKNIAQFSTDLGEKDIQDLLADMFKKELGHYSFNNLQILN